MKRHSFLLPLIGTALALGLSSCSQNSGGYADAETAQAVADGTMPPWMAEYADSSESGGYTSASAPASTPSYAYDPPAKPTGTKKASSTSSKKTIAKTSSKSSKKSTAKRKSTTYVVKKGDTLGAIARRNGSSVSAIKRANGLKSDLIRINQKLVIPRGK